MKTSLAYPFPLVGRDLNGTTSTPTPPGDVRNLFYPFAKRWVESYKEFPPGENHEVLVVFGSEDSATKEDKAIFDGLPCRFIEYAGLGLDCGSALFAAANTDSDFVVGMTSRVYFHRAGALSRLIEARDKFGEQGLYGSVGTYERCPTRPEVFPNPHLRTFWYGASSDHFRRFPYQLKSRPDVHQFECGSWSFTNWHKDHGYPVKMVTWDSYHDIPDWRNPDLKDIFRRGDQSQCLVFDKHTDLWRDASPSEKIAMSRSAGDK